METVSDWFAWRADSKSQSVEDQNADRYTVVSSWENRDVLYSFLGIYTIGLWVDSSTANEFISVAFGTVR